MENDGVRKTGFNNFGLSILMLFLEFNVLLLYH